MNRWEKMVWLQETTSTEFFNETLRDEMVRWMGEDDFNKFYDHLCRNWDIARTPNELEAKMNDKEYDEDTDSIVEEEELCHV
jgi:hypothetical protein